MLHHVFFFLSFLWPLNNVDTSSNKQAVSKSSNQIFFSQNAQLFYDAPDGVPSDATRVETRSINFTNWPSDSIHDTYAECSDLDCSYNYTFTGNKVYVSGAIGSSVGASIFKIDGIQVGHFDGYSTQENNPNKLIFESQLLDSTGPHTLRVEHGGPPERKLQVNNIFYLTHITPTRSPNPTPWAKPAGIPDTAEAASYSDMEFYGWGIENHRPLNGHYWTRVEGSSMTLPFYGNRFYVVGTKASDHGTMIILYDHQEVARIDTKITGSRQEFQLLYTSDVYELGNHTMSIVCAQDSVLIDFSYVFIESVLPTQTPEATPVPTPIGPRPDDVPDAAVAVAPLFFTYNDAWESSGKIGHPEQSWTNIPGATASYTFYGNRFYVTGVTKPTNTILIIECDGKEVKRIDTNGDTETRFKLLYTSEVMDIGYHTVVHKHGGSTSETNRYIDINSLYYETILPTQTPTASPQQTIITPPEIPADAIKVETGEITYDATWKEGLDNKAWTSTPGACAYYVFYGNRFYITGVVDQTHTVMEIYCDDIKVGEVNEYSPTKHDYVFLYKSEALSIGTHNISVHHNSAQGKYIEVCNFFYETVYATPVPTQSPTATILTPAQIPDDAIVIVTEDLNCFNPSEWTHQDNPESAWTTTESATLGFSFYGYQFFITGIKGLNYGSFKVVIDQREEFTVDTSAGSSISDPVYFYGSEKLDLQYHTVKIINQHATKIQISNAFYVTNPTPTPEPFPPLPPNATILEYNEILSDDRTNTTGDWTEETDEITTKGYLASLTFSYFGNNFWIYGNYNKSHGLMKIELDNVEKYIVNLNTNTDSNSQLLFATNDVEEGQHTLKIVNIEEGRSISISKIAYNAYYIPTETPTELATEPATEIPTEVPTEIITEIPTRIPTEIPTEIPTRIPTEIPTEIPTDIPTRIPTEVPTEIPTRIPTEVPTDIPTRIPTEVPTEIPTRIPTEIPTRIPTEVPTRIPTEIPTEVPTRIPTEIPTRIPTEVPTRIPTDIPTRIPTEIPTRIPTEVPTESATELPLPTSEQTSEQSPSPSPTQSASYDDYDIPEDAQLVNFTDIIFSGQWSINDDQAITSQSEAFLSFTFEGTSFFIIGAKDVNYAEMDINLDNTHLATINTYSPYRVENNVLFSSDDLSSTLLAQNFGANSTSHSVVITTTNNDNNDKFIEINKIYTANHSPNTTVIISISDTSTDDSDSDSSSKNENTFIIGVTFGLIILVALIAAIIVLVILIKRKRPDDRAIEMSMETAAKSSLSADGNVYFTNDPNENNQLYPSEAFPSQDNPLYHNQDDKSTIDFFEESM